jgi:hypothetical protein
MKENVGMIDRMIRFILAIIFIILGFMHSYWWFIPAAVALITGLLGWCGLYAVFGISTCSSKEVKTAKSAKKRKK